MMILVPVVYSENDERKAFLYKVSARTRSSIEGIEINENSELAKFQELAKTLVGPDSHIEVQVLPIDNTVRRIEEITDNMASMTLGIFLAIENQINNRHFKQNYDYVVVTGDIAGNCLKPIGDEDKKYEALKCYMEKEENRTRKAQFIYVKNEITLSPGLNEEKNIETFRIHGNTAYKKFMDSVFSIEGDTVEYYANYVEKNGLPSGIYKLAPGEIKNRSLSYKFVYKENRLIRVEQINSRGYPFAKSGTLEDPVIQEITYPDDKTIKVEIKSGMGKTEVIKEYKPDSKGFNRVNFLNPDETNGYYLNSNSLDRSATTSPDEYFTRAQIRGYLLERNSEGYITKKKYVRFQNSEEFQSDENGIYGIEYIRDERGLPLYEFYIDKNDEKMETSKGEGGERFFYDEEGNVIEQNSIHSDASNVNNKKGICKIKYKRDENGNVLEMSLFDKNDNKVSDKGYHKIVFIYDKGLKIERSNQDKCGKNTISTDDGIAITRINYNEQGYETRFSFFDEKGNPAFGKFENGFFSIAEMIRDVNGNLLESRYYDINGKPWKGEAGCEVIKHIYDTDGNGIEVICCDSSGNLSEDDEGIAKCQTLYDEYGRKIAEYNFDSNYKLKKRKAGYAVQKVEFDKKTGNISSISYYDENEKTVEIPEETRDYKYFKVEYYCDERGLDKEIRLYNSEGVLKDGICKETYTHDAHGILIERKNYNKNDELENDSSGRAVIKCYWKDDKKYEESFDKDNNILEHMEITFDKRRNPVKILLRKGNNLEFVYCQKQVYDERGNLIEMFYTNEDESALEDSYEGIAKQVFRYDERDNIIFTAYYDCNNQLCNWDDYAKKINKFDLRGNVIECYRYTKDGALYKERGYVCGFRYTYDALNRPVKCTYMGNDKKPVTGDDKMCCGYLIKYLSEKDCITSEFNSKNEVIREYKGQYYIKNDDDRRIIEYKLSNYSFCIGTDY